MTALPPIGDGGPLEAVDPWVHSGPAFTLRPSLVLWQDDSQQAGGWVHEAKIVADAGMPQAATLAAIAATGKLVICIGAGFSVASPTELPNAEDLAKAVHAKLTTALPNLPACDETDLVKVADAAATLPTGLELLRRTCLEVAHFTTADPNYGHQALAALLLEGALTALSWNWDTCVERSTEGEQILAVVSDADRLEVVNPSLLKLHGCAHRPATMLVCSADLEEPQAWARAEMAGRLSDSVVVFVGIGDVAAYTRDHVKEVVEAVGNSNHVYVVSRSIVAKWDESMWSAVVADLPPDNRIALTADAFMEALASAVLVRLLQQVEASVGDNPGLKAASARASALVTESKPLTVFRLGRTSGVHVEAGHQCLLSNNGRRALLALGALLTDEQSTVTESYVEMDGTHTYLLVSPDDLAASEFTRAARARLERSRNSGHEGPVRFVVSGALGALPAPGGDILVDPMPDDILAGAQGEQPDLVSAWSVIEAA